MAQWITDILQSPLRVAMPIMTHPGIELTGKRVVDAVTDGQTHFEAIKAVVQTYGMAACTVIMDLTVEAEAFGAPVDFPDDEVPYVTGRLVSGADVCPGVKDKCMACAAYCPLDLFGKKLHGERVCFRLYGIPQINDIRCVDDDVADSVFLHIFPGRLDVQFAYIFPPCVLGSACIKHESIGTVRNSFLS